MQVDRSGSFLVKEIDRALGQTAKQGLPQLIIKAQIVNYFDQDNEEWMDFSEYGMEVLAYFTMAYNGENGLETTLSFSQIMKVYNWDGRDFQVLTEIPAPDLFLLRVKDNDPEYADKNPFTVCWIDVADADPRSGLKKLDAAGIKNLQAKFGALLNKGGKVAPPVSAKKAPSVAPKIKSPEPKVADKKAAKLAKSKYIAEENARLEAEGAKAAKKTPPKPPVVKAKYESDDTCDGVVTGSKTKQEAYEYVYEMQAAGTTDDQRNQAWVAAIAQVAGDVDQKEITGEQWYQIMHETLNDIGAV